MLNMGLPVNSESPLVVCDYSAEVSAGTLDIAGGRLGLQWNYLTHIDDHLVVITLYNVRPMWVQSTDATDGIKPSFMFRRSSYYPTSKPRVCIG